MRRDLVDFARAAAEVADLDRLAAQRAAATLDRIRTLEKLMAATSWSPEQRDFYAGVFMALRGLVLKAGRLVTGGAVLAEINIQVYDWAQSAGLTPTIGDDLDLRLAPGPCGAEDSPADNC